MKLNITLKESRVDENGREYIYTEYNKTLPNGTPYSETRYLTTDIEKTANDIELEIKQLEETIAKKKLRDMDYTAELERLNEIDPI